MSEYLANSIDRKKKLFRERIDNRVCYSIAVKQLHQLYANPVSAFQFEYTRYSRWNRNGGLTQTLNCRSIKLLLYSHLGWMPEGQRKKLLRVSVLDGYNTEHVLHVLLTMKIYS